MTRRSPLSALLLLAALALPGAALAHAHLKTSAPAADATVASAPAALTLDFSEGLTLAFSGVTVTGPKGAKVATGAAHLAKGNAKELIVPLTGTLAPGHYTVAWKALSEDGHKTHGSYGFTLTGK